MARQWSARCYGVARQREGSRQNSIRVYLFYHPYAREVSTAIGRRGATGSLGNERGRAKTASAAAPR
jgi:hypothetical protein